MHHPDLLFLSFFFHHQHTLILHPNPNFLIFSSTTHPLHHSFLVPLSYSQMSISTSHLSPFLLQTLRQHSNTITPHFHQFTFSSMPLTHPCIPTSSILPITSATLN